MVRCAEQDAISVKRRYFELIRSGVKGAEAAREAGGSLVTIQVA
jgi:hypothetical protein